MRLPHIEQPAPCAAEGVALHRVGVVVQDMQGIEALRFQVGVHFVGRAPPIIVVALHDELLARKLLQKREIPAGIGQAHGPADIPRQHDGVLRGDEFAPAALQPLYVIVPPREKYPWAWMRRRKDGYRQAQKVPFCYSCSKFGSRLIAQRHLRDLLRVDDGVEALRFLAQRRQAGGRVMMRWPPPAAAWPRNRWAGRHGPVLPAHCAGT